MSKVAIKKLPRFFRLIDVLLIPVMYFLGKFKKDSIQETHSWHIQSLNITDIRLDLATGLETGDDTSRFLDNKGWLFHAPIFGGWKKYSTYEVNRKVILPFYLGWVIYYNGNPDPRVIISKLPIFDYRIRCLIGNSATKSMIFAVQADGLQVPIRRISSGVLGEGSNRNIRLF